MHDIHKILNKYSLNINNSIIIGSGIMHVLNIKESHDIDITVGQETFDRLSKLPEFKIKNVSGLDVLTSDCLEVGTGIHLDKINHTYCFEEMFQNSIIIDNVRYITLEFLLNIKKSWLREKDKKDIEIIEKYLQSQLIKGE